MDLRLVGKAKDEIIYDYNTGINLSGKTVVYDRELLDKIAKIVYDDVIRDIRNRTCNFMS